MSIVVRMTAQDNSSSSGTLFQVPEKTNADKPGIPLTIKLPPIKKNQAYLNECMQDLYRRKEFTDVQLVCEEKNFNAHCIVLAAESEVFKDELLSAAADGGARQIRLTEISNPEAVGFMLDYMYGMDANVWQDYNPRTQEINKDVLRLARRFRLPGLADRAVHWLSKDLTTANVVERLSICEDFGLDLLREKILEQLTFNRRALAEISHSPNIMQYPKLMQDLLKLAATAPGEDAGQSKGKWQKKA